MLATERVQLAAAAERGFGCGLRTARTCFQKNLSRPSINVDILSTGNAFAPPVTNQVAPLLGFIHNVHCGTARWHG